MALIPVPIATTGATHTAQQFRMMVRDLARGNQGVTEGDDLRVTALAVNGAGVQIGDGSAVITGKASPIQGSYSVYNVGSDTVPIAATGGTGRSDMVILRVEDPEYEGTRNPETDPIAFFDVIPNVSSSATAVPAGYSAIPLARVDIPPSTATITNAMIKDLRKVANPRRERIIYTHFATNPPIYISGTSETWHNFPTAANWTIPVPAWAARVKVLFTVAGLALDGGYVFGGLTFNFGGKEAAQWVSIDDNQSGWRRQTYVAADTLSLTDTAGAPLRGTNITLRSRMRTRASNAGVMIVDGATTFIADVEFEEGAL